MRRDQKLAEQIAAFIRNNLDKDLRTDKLARRFLMNSTALKRLFHRFFHQPVHHFIREERLLKSRDLLQKTDDSLYTVAEKIGLNSISTFSKAFRQRFGVTPGTCRKNSQEQRSRGQDRSTAEKKPGNDKRST
jgi:two-component system response regulator YesN